MWLKQTFEEYMDHVESLAIKRLVFLAVLGVVQRTPLLVAFTH